MKFLASLPYCSVLKQFPLYFPPSDYELKTAENKATMNHVHYYIYKDRERERERICCMNISLAIILVDKLIFL